MSKPVMSNTVAEEQSAITSAIISSPPRHAAENLALISVK
jgi:hypothetical protein